MFTKSCCLTTAHLHPQTAWVCITDRLIVVVSGHEFLNLHDHAIVA
jgi:hypothetical protein